MKGGDSCIFLVNHIERFRHLDYMAENKFWKQAWRILGRSQCQVLWSHSYMPIRINCMKERKQGGGDTASVGGAKCSERPQGSLTSLKNSLARVSPFSDPVFQLNKLLPTLQVWLVTKTFFLVSFSTKLSQDATHTSQMTSHWPKSVAPICSFLFSSHVDFKYATWNQE